MPCGIESWRKPSVRENTRARNISVPVAGVEKWSNANAKRTRTSDFTASSIAREFLEAKLLNPQQRPGVGEAGRRPAKFARRDSAQSKQVAPAEGLAGRCEFFADGAIKFF